MRVKCASRETGTLENPEHLIHAIVDECSEFRVQFNFFSISYAHSSCSI
jgi:hypothetical protein